MNEFPRAGFLRRFAAIIYDALVAIAISMVTGLLMLVVLLVMFQNQWIGHQGFEHFSELMQQSTGYKLLLDGWMLFWVCVFFLWFWKHGGQTIGMRAWRIRILSRTEQPITYRRAILRMLASVGGLGTLLVLFDPKNKLSLQDRIASTEVVFLSTAANHHRSWKGLDS